MNFFEQVLEILKADERFFSEDGTFLRNAVYEAAMQMDKALIESLFKNEATKKRFFTEVDGIYVFDKIGFGWTIDNREFLPDSFTRYKNKIGLTGGGSFISASGDVELVFPYKDCILEGGQTREDQKRSEIFYNTLLAPDEVDRLLYPKVFTKARLFKGDGEEIPADTFSEEDGIIVKGNNLLALSSLLKRYEKRVKCIYIDPPYNPSSAANTFCYNNTFNRSSWLTFMKDRLEAAKKFLSAEGVLIVAIDKNEQPRLQILIEELFPEYDTDCITVVHNPRGTIGTNFSYTHEFAIFVTPKNKKTICNRVLRPDEIEWSPLRNWGTESGRYDAANCFYPILVKDGEIVGFGEDVTATDLHPKQTEYDRDTDTYRVFPIDTNGVERKWRYARQSIEGIKDLLRAKKTKSGYDIEFGKNFGVYKTVWADPKYDANIYGTQLLKNILPDTTFTYPKSLYNVMDCINAVVMNDKDAIVMDFFGGSGTTAHAVMELNKDGGKRKFILVEQMDYIEKDTLARSVKIMRAIAPHSAILYFELARSNQTYVDRIREASDGEIPAIWEDMQRTGFISSKIDPKDVDPYAADFKALSLDDKKRLLMDLLDMNQLYVNYCDIDDETFGVSDADKSFTKSFYGDK